MKVQELVANVNNAEFDLAGVLEVKAYLPIEVKKVIAQSIIYECTDETDGVSKMDSVQRYLSYVKYMITMHTNLEYKDEDYDTLCSVQYHNSTLLNAIMNCFKRDTKECEMILNLMIDDYEKEISLESSIAKFLNGLTVAAANLADKFGNVDIKTLIPDGIDMDKLSTFLEKYIK